MTELEKYYCVSSVMTIAPLLNTNREKMGAMSIMQVINDGVYVFICRVFSDVFKKYTSHAFVYVIYFSQLEKIECCGAIIDNRYHVPICVLEEKYRTIKITLKNLIMKLLKEVVLLIMHPKLPQVIFHNI